MKFPGNLYDALFLLAVTFFLILYAGNGWAEEQKINMKDWLFYPDILMVSKGDTVTWVNDDNTVHDLVFEAELTGFPKKDDPHIIRIGKEHSLKFEKAGEYQYYCKRHLDFDMIGKIIVK